MRPLYDLDSLTVRVLNTIAIALCKSRLRTLVPNGTGLAFR